MKQLDMSDGSKPVCRLVVRNVTGIAEERGFRLYWEPIDPKQSRYIVPALGLATSSPFRTEGLARAYAAKNWPEEKVVRIPTW